MTGTDRGMTDHRIMRGSRQGDGMIMSRPWSTLRDQVITRSHHHDWDRAVEPESVKIHYHYTSHDHEDTALPRYIPVDRAS